jgi:RNA polymerase sigma factor (sigma-70 family)
MIVRSIDKLGDAEINQASLYEVFTGAWIHRDHWRDVLSAEDKTNFLTILAQQLWQEDLEVIHYSALLERIRADLAERISNQQELVEIDNEIRTASFLTRNDAGFYGFAHKSYQEYFFARFIAGELTEGRIESLYTRRISPEVVGFLAHMLAGTRAEVDLEQVLTSKYRPMISENALAILYGLRKNSALAASDVRRNFSVNLPDGCDLNGSQLEQISLEGAILRNADLNNANLNEAILTRIDLSSAKMNESILTKTSLTGARLRSCTMSNCTFKESNLEGADISESTIDGVDFSDAQLTGLVFENVGFNDVVVTRAILSDDLATVIRHLTRNSLKGDVTADEAFQLDELWHAINSVRGLLIAHSRRRLLLSSNAEAEDLVEDVILQLMTNKQTLAKMRSLSTQGLTRFLFRNITRAANDAIRSKSKSFSISLLDDDEVSTEWRDIAAEHVDIKDYLDSAIDRSMAPDQKLFVEELDNLMSKELSDVSHRVFRQHFLEGLSVIEIASELGMSPSYVVRLITRVRQKAQKYVIDQVGEK